MIRSLLLAAASSLILGSAGLAADLPTAKGPPVYEPPPPPAFSWTGFYVGGQVGYGWGNDPSATTFPPFGVIALFPGGIAQNAGTNVSGIVGGGHVGYNYQIAQFVFGLEADANGSSESGSVIDANGDTGFIRKEFDASIRGRAGLAFDRFLVYATGGGAYGDFRVGVTTPAGLTEAHYPDHFGWTVGGGVEYAIDPNWSVRAEYRYTDYGSTTVAYTTIPAVTSIRYHFRDNRVQAGFSYRFGDVPPPAPPVAAKY